MKIIVITYFVLSSCVYRCIAEENNDKTIENQKYSIDEKMYLLKRKREEIRKCSRKKETTKRPRIVNTEIGIKEKIDKIEKGYLGEEFLPSICYEEFAKYCKHNLEAISSYLLNDSIHIRLASSKALFLEIEKINDVTIRRKHVATLSELLLDEEVLINSTVARLFRALNKDDFNNEAKDNIEKAFDKNSSGQQMSHLILLAGIAEVRGVIDKLDRYNFEIPNFITNEEIEKQMQERIANIRQTRESMHTIREDAERKKREMRNFHGYHSWLAELVKARDGNKESIEKVLKTVQLETDVVSKITKAPKDLAYVYQPEIIPVLVDMLNSSQPAPYPGSDAKVEALYFASANAIVKVIKDCPVSDISSKDDVEALRQWMSDKNNWVLKEK